MAIVRVHGKPTYFVTFTCNPRWPEIREALLGDQEPQSRPDLLARVFAMKLKALLQEITTNGIFGRTVAMLMVVEFQKRGKLKLTFDCGSWVCFACFGRSLPTRPSKIRICEFARAVGKGDARRHRKHNPRAFPVSKVIFCRLCKRFMVYVVIRKIRGWHGGIYKLE